MSKKRSPALVHWSCGREDRGDNQHLPPRFLYYSIRPVSVEYWIHTPFVDDLRKVIIFSLIQDSIQLLTNTHL